MQDLGWKALTTFVKERTYHALRRYTADVGVSHSRYLLFLLEEDLRKKGYLPAEPRRALRRNESDRSLTGGTSGAILPPARGGSVVRTRRRGR